MQRIDKWPSDRSIDPWRYAGESCEECADRLNHMDDEDERQDPPEANAEPAVEQRAQLEREDEEAR